MNYKSDYIGIKFEKGNVTIANVKKFIKKNSVDDVVFFFDTETHNLMIRCCMRNGNMEYNIPFSITTLNHKFKKIVVKVTPSYEECNWLLSDEYILDCNSHNLDGIHMNDNGTDYWLDTLFIRKGNKLIRHDEISFDGYKMFY